MPTTSRIGRAGGAAVALAAVTLGLAACARDAVPAGDIEQKINQFVQQAEGRPAAAVVCPQPLPAKPGSSIRCEVTSAGGRVYGVTVKATSVDGEAVNYTFKVYDDKPS